MYKSDTADTTCGILHATYIYNNQPYICCPACNGTRVQRRASDGLKVICPACNGTGTIPDPSWYQPYLPQPYEPIPWYPSYPIITYSVGNGTTSNNTLTIS